MNSQIQDQQDAERRFDSAAFLKTVPELPGVYRMYNEKDQIIYVGKAKNLSNRLHSYFVKDLSSEKTRALVRNIHHIEFSITYSESDALILEQNLIKENRPKYNILLRDDKSYPYILITDDQYPAIYYHRGAKKLKGTYYGPYPNSSAVKDSLKILQNIFPVRQCSEATYRNRSRPCLMYQIKKCLGPCISGLVSDSEYRRNVELTAMFLSGRYNELISSLTGQMQQASDNCEFERAITIRDQIFALRKVQEQQVVDDYNSPDTDILGIQYRNGMACVNAMYHRHGQMIGTRNFFLKCSYDQDLKEILQAFIWKTPFQKYAAAGSGLSIRFVEAGRSFSVLLMRMLKRQSAAESSRRICSGSALKGSSSCSDFSRVPSTGWNATIFLIPSVKEQWPHVWCSTVQARLTVPTEFSTSRA